MSMRTLFAVLTLGCSLAACDEDGPTPAQDDFEDASSTPIGRVDGGVFNPGNPNPQPGTDGSVLPGTDGSVLPATDAGVVAPDAGVTTSDGGAPAALGAKFFLPTSEPNNTAAPSVEIDAQNNTHTIYPAYVRGGAYYAFCPHGACTTENDAQVVEFATDGTVANAMIALTADGKPRILLSSFAYLYYGECDSNCGQQANWTLTMILKHDNNKEVTGEAFTIDNNGHPRFLIHTYRALFGIGQKPAKTELAQCDANCTDPSSWQYDTIADPEIWYGSTLRYDATGKIHVATNVFDYKTENPNPDVGAYLSCVSDCANKDNWHGIGFFAPYESSSEAVSMKPAVTLALSKAGNPRFAQIHKNKDGVKTVSYFSCEHDCEADNWIYAWSYSGTNVHPGLDLALDAQDHPRLVHTVDYNIAISYCDDADCATTQSKWNSTLVEAGGEIPADDIFLEWNCTIGAWFLHNPSIAVASDGKPVIGYQSRDVSGGWSNPNPNKPSCVAGTDMTWSRLAVMNAAY